MNDGINATTNNYSGFWSSLTGDANSYLETNGSNTNTSINGYQLKSLYNNYLQNGDNGVITNALYNNDNNLQNGTGSLDAIQLPGNFIILMMGKERLLTV